MPQDFVSPIDRAIRLLDGAEPGTGPAELAELGEQLKQARAFPWAQKIFALARERLGPADDPALATKLRQSTRCVPTRTPR